ncbi:MAG: site-specific DNA-methyltransferase [Patescibacteria group bacterium]
MKIQKIKRGDIIQLGEHRLLFGDSRDQEKIKELIGNSKINLILSDPPYGIDYVASKSGFSQSLGKPKDIANDQLQSEDEYIKFTEDWLKVILPYLDRKNSIYIFNSDKMIFALRQAMKNIGIYFSQLLIWAKSNAVIGRLDYLPMHELIAYGWFGTHSFKKSKDKSILFCPKPSKSKLHPTIKPLSLLRRLILNSTNIGDVVYDGFGGSGSTLMAAEMIGRKCLMVETDEEYCQTIINRYYRLKNISESL